jgi:hypothetical protein
LAVYALIGHSLSVDTHADMPLVAALAGVAAAVRAAPYPMSLPGAAAAREAAVALAGQLDDYVVPRLRRLDAPALAVVGGSTGAGKSTLVNSLVRTPVSPAGVLRPTTRSPLLVCHPSDLPWFADQALLPGFVRSARRGQGTLQVINAPALAPGLALLDAPDIDSVVAANRTLARELLLAGDLWLFVTTAARYADAVPWRVLHEGRDRGAAVAVVLDRVPQAARDDIAVHFDRMLDAQGLRDTPVFVVTESDVDSQGLLPEHEVAPIASWLDSLSRSGPHRYSVVRQTLLGAVAAVAPQVEQLARAGDDQVSAATTLRSAAEEAYASASSELERDLRAGVVLRGEVYSRWREIVDNDELRQALRTLNGPHRSHVSAALAERPMPGRRFGEAVLDALSALVVDACVGAAQRCQDSWLDHPIGRELLAQDPALGHPSPGMVDTAYELVHTWYAALRSEVRTHAPRVRTRTRSYVTAATVLLVTVSVISPPPDQVTTPGAEASMLRAVAEVYAIRELAQRARDELCVRIDAVLGLERDRRRAAVAALGVDQYAAQRMRDSASQLRRAWSVFATVAEAA